MARDSKPSKFVKGFPETLYVQKYDEPEVDFDYGGCSFVDEIASSGSGDVVAEYKLVRVGKIQTKTTYTFTTKEQS